MKGLPAVGSIAGGIGRGAAYGATSAALPAVEGGIENTLSYQPHSNPLYDGIADQDRQSLFLNSDTNPATRSWGSWLDQSLTSSGGVKNTLNDGIAGRWFGPLGSLGMMAAHAPANLYSDIKGLSQWATQAYKNNQMANTSDQQLRDQAEISHQAGLAKQSASIDDIKGELEELKELLHLERCRNYSIACDALNKEVVRLTQEAKEKNAVIENAGVLCKQYLALLGEAEKALASVKNFFGDIGRTDSYQDELIDACLPAIHAVLPKGEAHNTAIDELTLNDHFNELL
ncbi:unnamed protein product [Sphagnum jensenii]|uniref:Uncharacterized protein n=1 Tax=Sphagnum jensenii TaxID=128206 RepID=A0ABP0VCI9_9BRYO